jgi:hypothetical protein
MDVLVPFAAAAVAFALARGLSQRRRYAWAAALAAYGVAAAAMAWGAADGWDARSFRVYYLAGGLLTAPLLGVGSLLFSGRRWAAPVGLLYAGFAVGLAVAMPVHGQFGSGLPPAQDHVGSLPRIAAVAGNGLGTLAVVAVAFASFRSRPLGNSLIVAGVAVAAAGSGLSGLGVAGVGAFVLVAVCLLYVGVAGVPGRARRR